MSSSVGCPKLPIGRGCVSLGHLVTYSPPREKGWLRQRRRRGGRSRAIFRCDRPPRPLRGHPSSRGTAVQIRQKSSLGGAIFLSVFVFIAHFQNDTFNPLS